MIYIYFFFFFDVRVWPTYPELSTWPYIPGTWFAINACCIVCGVVTQS